MRSATDAATISPPGTAFPRTKLNRDLSASGSARDRLAHSVGLGHQGHIVRLPVPTARTKLGQRKLRQTVGIMFSQSELIDDEERRLAANIVGAIDCLGKKLQHPVKRYRHDPDRFGLVRPGVDIDWSCFGGCHDCLHSVTTALCSGVFAGRLAETTFDAP